MIDNYAVVQTIINQGKSSMKLVDFYHIVKDAGIRIDNKVVTDSWSKFLSKVESFHITVKRVEYKISAAKDGTTVIGMV